MDGQSREKARGKIFRAGRTIGKKEKLSERDIRQAKRKIFGRERTAGEKRGKSGSQENGGRRFLGEATNSGENDNESCEKIASEQIVEGETKEFFGVQTEEK